MADTAPAPSTNGRVFECTTLRGIRCYVRTDDPPAAEAALVDLLATAAVPVAAPAAELLRFRRQAKPCAVSAQV